jgi:FkbM family methyltransferase
MFKKRHCIDEIALLDLDDLANQDRWRIERQSRYRSRSAYIGNNTAICRVMGRYKLYVATDDIGFGSHMLLDGIWEPWVTIFMARFLKRGMCVADVGANHGYFTVLMADIVGPEGRVIAFEPHPRTASLLRKSLAVNGFGERVEVVECAVSDMDGASLTFHMPTGEPKNARIVDRTHDSIATVTVRSTTLTTSLADWAKLDFIKIDVEGAEEAALRGGADLLERTKPSLLLEYNALRCVNPAELLNWLSEIYGDPLVLEFDTSLSQVTQEELLDRTRVEDWMLLYQVKN